MGPPLRPRPGRRAGTVPGGAGDPVRQEARPGRDGGQRVEFLTGYQNAAYAAEYQAFVDKVQAAEARLGQGTRLTEAVARYLFKLMAYKDEYEVARLHTDAAFTRRVEGMFEGDYKLVHHLAPPALAARERPRASWSRRALGPGCARPWACWPA